MENQPFDGIVDLRIGDKLVIIKDKNKIHGGILC